MGSDFQHPRESPKSQPIKSHRRRQCRLAPGSHGYGNRLVRIPVSEFFQTGIENEEQLDAALGALREKIIHQIGQGKKVLIQ